MNTSNSFSTAGMMQFFAPFVAALVITFPVSSIADAVALFSAIEKNPIQEIRNLNVIDVCEASGERAYIEQLACMDGSQPQFSKRRSAGPRNPISNRPFLVGKDVQGEMGNLYRPLQPGEIDDHIIDEYDAKCGVKTLTLRLDMYHCEKAAPSFAVPGLVFKTRVSNSNDTSPIRSLLPQCPVTGLKNNCQGTDENDMGGKYSGEFKDDHPDGQGKATMPKGEVYVGAFKRGKFHGQGTLVYSDGFKYTGSFVEGARSGLGSMSKSDGIKFIGEFRNNKLGNSGRFITPAGTYVGEFKDTLPDGYGGYFELDGTLREAGLWKEGRLIKRIDVPAQEESPSMPDVPMLLQDEAFAKLTHQNFLTKDEFRVMQIKMLGLSSIEGSPEEIGLVECYVDGITNFVFPLGLQKRTRVDINTAMENVNAATPSIQKCVTDLKSARISTKSINASPALAAMTLDDLRVDFPLLKGKKINVKAIGAYVMNSFMLRSNPTDMSPIAVDISKLDRSQKLKIVQTCADIMVGCSVTVLGTVGTVGFQNGVFAEKVEWK